MMKRMLAIVLVVTMALCGCCSMPEDTPDYYYGAKWVSRYPEAWFANLPKHYFSSGDGSFSSQDFPVGNILVNGKSINMEVRMAGTGEIYFDCVDDEQVFSTKGAFLEGKIINKTADRFVMRVTKDTDHLLGDSLDEIVFTREVYMLNESEPESAN